MRYVNSLVCASGMPARTLAGMARTKRDITDRQRRFAEHYVVHCNGSEAALHAGYGKTSARKRASELLRNPDVAGYISRLQARRIERTEVTADRVVSELAAIAFADVREVMELDDSGRVVMKPTSEWRPQTTAAIAELHQDKDGVIKLKMHDRIAAMRLLAQHLGMLKINHDVVVKPIGMWSEAECAAFLGEDPPPETEERANGHDVQ